MSDLTRNLKGTSIESHFLNLVKGFMWCFFFQVLRYTSRANQTVAAMSVDFAFLLQSGNDSRDLTAGVFYTENLRNRS